MVLGFLCAQEKLHKYADQLFGPDHEEQGEEDDVPVLEIIRPNSLHFAT